MYPESSATCTNNAVEVTVRHAVSLGVHCQDSSTAEFFYYRLDAAFECADAEHNFKIDASDGKVRYICGESATFAVGSTSSQSVRNVSATTDEGWLTVPDGCYNLADTPPTLVIPSPPTVLPTTFPTAYPTAIPSAIVVSVSPTMKETVKTQAPVVVQAPMQVPTVADPVVSPVSNPDDGGNSTVIAIGAAVGGVAIAAVIGFFLFYSRRSKASTESKPSNVSTYTESNTDDDYASSRSPTSLSGPMGNSVMASLVHQPSPTRQAPAPFHPTTAAPSGKRDVYVPDLNMPMRSDISPQTASSSSQRSSYPINHVVDVKDQCRSVAMVQPPSPRFVSQADSNVPFAVALGVSTTIASESSGNSSKREPSGRTAMDA